MARDDDSKRCKHLESLGQQEVFVAGRKKPVQVVDKGFKCLADKYPPHKVGPKMCVPRKRDCFEAREPEEETPAEAPATEQPETDK